MLRNSKAFLHLQRFSGSTRLKPRLAAPAMPAVPRRRCLSTAKGKAALCATDDADHDKKASTAFKAQKASIGTLAIIDASALTVAFLFAVISGSLFADEKNVDIYAHSCMKVKPLEFFTNKPEVLAQEQLAWSSSVFELREGVVKSNENKDKKAKAKKSADDMEDEEEEEADVPLVSVEAGKKVIGSFGSKLTSQQVHELVAQSTPSLVGKGSKTVFDQDVRKSIEIAANRIKLAPAFEQAISKQVRLGRKCASEISYAG